MTADGPLIRNVSDTARWIAAQRADETERPDAAFRDPYARRLAGERGAQIARAMAFGGSDWSIVARTCDIDRIIDEQVSRGISRVVNLAAGLDTRPYRMSLPPSLEWVEIDLPGILEYKDEILENEKPVCALERIRLDLSDATARGEALDRLGGQSKRTLILTEGLLIYLPENEVASLAADLARELSFERWILDLMSPRLMKMLMRRYGSRLVEAGAPFKFAPKEGTEFFARFGWKLAETRSPLKTAARLKRLPFLLRYLSWFPESKSPRNSRPWSAICLFER
ncbi:MAG TPA: SAM-dependent methyltransferase [Candidatus Acidoferrales bacterium]|nr:SAM-dependent methyltransferase [Candidatus Acidoferrales bacterium]